MSDTVPVPTVNGVANGELFCCHSGNVVKFEVHLHTNVESRCVDPITGYGFMPA